MATAADPPMCCIGELLSEGIHRLGVAGVPTPRLDAELLLAHALGVRRLDLHAHPERRPERAGRLRWEESLARRERREPLPYIRGEVEFYGLPFRVGPAALIPRPETEILVDAAARRLPRDAVILDVGTGSGCIALALAHTLPAARIYGLDPSSAALALARENADALGLQERVTWIEGSWQEQREHPSFPVPLDAIVANPPYIPTREVDRLEPELHRYEPRLALDGGPDGLDLTRPLIQDGWRLLRTGGILAMEMALGQDGAVRGLAGSVPEWSEVSIVPDLAGIPRVLLARRGP